MPARRAGCGRRAKDGNAAEGGADDRAAVPMGGRPQVEGVATFIVHNLTGDPGHPLSRVQKSLNIFSGAEVVGNKEDRTDFDPKNGGRPSPPGQDGRHDGNGHGNADDMQEDLVEELQLPLQLQGGLAAEPVDWSGRVVPIHYCLKRFRTKSIACVASGTKQWRFWPGVACWQPWWLWS